MKESRVYCARTWPTLWQWHQKPVQLEPGGLEWFGQSSPCLGSLLQISELLTPLLPYSLVGTVSEISGFHSGLRLLYIIHCKVLCMVRLEMGVSCLEFLWINFLWSELPFLWWSDLTRLSNRLNVLVVRVTKYNDHNRLTGNCTSLLWQTLLTEGVICIIHIRGVIRKKHSII